ncbi:MAG: envelope stress response membrane protein PspB [Gammaproteobacteria bacterium]|nr:envelope stress response membrane protein PspB [Gammaproteobacteria bacterium]MXW07319.1 envelope stress response membrane protein PspB [Gammaproteobacteria bacterium]MYC26266.1 envelope stress response membrane protein PspB [Gammaproteobacteria bacterium]
MFVEDIFGVIFIFGGVCAILFLVVCLPLWLILHYSRSKRAHRILAREDREELQRLEDHAEELSERVDTLEKILDHSAPRWRRTQTDRE